jgi:hypothetical protein
MRFPMELLSSSLTIAARVLWSRFHCYASSTVIWSCCTSSRGLGLFDFIPFIIGLVWWRVCDHSDAIHAVTFVFVWCRSFNVLYDFSFFFACFSLYSIWVKKLLYIVFHIIWLLLVPYVPVIYHYLSRQAPSIMWPVLWIAYAAEVGNSFFGFSILNLEFGNGFMSTRCTCSMRLLLLGLYYIIDDSVICCDDCCSLSWSSFWTASHFLTTVTLYLVFVCYYFLYREPLWWLVVASNLFSALS